MRAPRAHTERSGARSESDGGDSGQTRRHATRHRPPPRLGRGRHGLGRPRGRGPSEDRADRTRPAGGADPPRGRAARAPPDRRASRRRARSRRWWRRCERRWCGRRRRPSTSSPPRCPNRSSRSPSGPGPPTSPGHRRATSGALREPRRLRHVPPGAGRARSRTRGWDVHLFDAKDVESRGGPPPRRPGRRGAPGATGRLGPPWTKDHRMALAATIVDR